MIYKQKDQKWYFESVLEAIKAWIDKFVFHIASPSTQFETGYVFKWDLWKASRKGDKR